MDTNYLKQTVGPILSSALASLITYGYDSTSAGPRGLDAITFIGEYLLHHDESLKKVAVAHKQRAELQAMKEAAIASEQTGREHRRRFEDEIKRRTSQIFDQEMRAEEEQQRAKAAEAEAERQSAANTTEGGSGEKPDAEPRRGVPEPIQEGEEEKEDGGDAAIGETLDGDSSKTHDGGGSGVAGDAIAEEKEEEEDY